MKRICVFCGSGLGNRPEYAAAAVSLGRALADMNIGLVYGGAGIGIMGRLAGAVLDRGGEVIGVLPEFLSVREVAFAGLSDLRVVSTMHERKALMADLSDGFMALPGGLGTIDEFVEMLTWLQLGLHSKPCGLLNVAGYFDAFIRFLDHVTAEGFVDRPNRDMVLVCEQPQALIKQMQNFRVFEKRSKIDWAVAMNNCR